MWTEGKVGGMNILSRLVGGSKVNANRIAATSSAVAGEERVAMPGMELANGELPIGSDRGRFLVKKRRYHERIEYLRQEARQDGYDLNPDSGEDFWRFVDSNPNFRKGDVILLDNGNLRAYWDDKHGDQIGLHFLGSGMVNYVIFSRSEPTREEIHGYGNGDFEVVKRQIEAFGLWKLVNE